MRVTILSLMLLALSGGAAVAQTEPAAAAPADPYERTNRSLFAMHQSIDRGVIAPVARGYKAVTPEPVRKGLRNFLNNLGEPVTFINQVLQGRAVPAGETATRFVANSTVGVLGMFDVAKAAGVPRHEEDFGQTLATYGVQPGPYLFVPVVGPTNARDLSGRVVDIALNPVNAVGFEGSAAFRSGAVLVNGVDARAAADAEIQRLQASATDPYATYRSLYAQNRQARINNGEANVDALPEFEDFAPPPPSESETPGRRRR
jgi:phospholipid-binding lipoprotein MlaA